MTKQYRKWQYGPLMFWSQDRLQELKKKKSLDQYCGMKIDITILNRILLNQIRKISEIGKKSPTTSFVGSSPFHGQL